SCSIRHVPSVTLFCFLMLRPPPSSSLFPYTTLFRSRWGAAVVALLTIVTFLPAPRNEFVGNFDDAKNFLTNPHYRGLGWTQIEWMFTTMHMGQYVPFTWITLGLDYLLWGMSAAGYHLTSLLLHAVTAVLFYSVSRHLIGLATGRLDASATAAGAA